MRYYHKRPGDLLWKALDTPSIPKAAAGHRLGADWRYRIEGDSTDRTLAQLIEMDRIVHEQAGSSPTDPSLLGPDATWGYIEVAMFGSLLAFVLFVPARPGADPSMKYFVAALAVFWLGDGVRRIRLARAWKRRHLHAKGLTKR